MKELLEFARDVVHSELFGKELKIPDKIKKYDEKRGVFVTIHKDGNLRGCIGFVIGVLPLYEGVKRAAISAAFEDPRFDPISKDEYDSLEFEISILTVPKVIKAEPTDLPKKIKIGRDGLICCYGPYSGLLLPQVPVEWGWDNEEFLSSTCEKAGLPRDFWKNGKAEFKSFQAEIFSESKSFK